MGIIEVIEVLIMAGKLVTLNEWLAARFKTPPPLRTARRWCENGEIPAKKIGKCWFVDASKELQQTNSKSVDELVGRVLAG